MANKPTMESVFRSLSAIKKGIVRKYCRLHVSKDLPSDFLVEQFSSIWEQVADDPQMIMFLELADYVYSDVCEDDLDVDKRSYLSEYLAKEVGLEPELKIDLVPDLVDTPIEDSISNLSEASPDEMILLKCKNGDFIMVKKEVISQENKSECSQRWICNNCGGGVAQHTIVRFPLRTAK